jgi:16S rRNA G966 N2-methylase RsmD
MSERGLHQIEDDLNETWLEDWAGAGVLEIEALLAKHAAFLTFLESQEA